MKKILLSISLLLLGIVLVSCDGGSKGGVPTVNEKNKVTLTSQEVSELLGNIELENLSSKLSLDLKVNGVVDRQSLVVDAVANFFADIEGNVNGKLNLKVESADLNVDGEASLYVVSKDKQAYFDVDASVAAALFGQSVTLDLKGKYKTPIELSEADELLPIPIDLDIESILNEIQNPENLGELANYSGLTFYKKGKEVRIKLEITKALILENEELFKDLELDLDDISELDFVLVIVVDNNNLKEAGADLKFKGAIEGNNLEITLKLHLSFGVTMPKFPSFKDYEDFDPTSIFGE